MLASALNSSPTTASISTISTLTEPQSSSRRRSSVMSSTATQSSSSTPSTPTSPSSHSTGATTPSGSPTTSSSLVPSPTTTSSETLVDYDRRRAQDNHYTVGTVASESFPQFATFWSDVRSEVHLPPVAHHAHTHTGIVKGEIKRRSSWRKKSASDGNGSRGMATQTDEVVPDVLESTARSVHVPQRASSQRKSSTTSLGQPPNRKRKLDKAPTHTDDAKGVEEVPLFTLLFTYFGYVVLILFGHIRDFFGKKFKSQDYEHLIYKDGMAPLTDGFESFYRRRLYFRICDVFNREFTGVPGRHISVLDRYSRDQNHTFHHTGKVHNCLNLSSYNYLGFAQNSGTCAEEVQQCIEKNGVSMQSPANEAGTSELHVQTEKLVAEYLGVESAMLVSMGHATNTTTISAFVGKGSLIISDELNHNSLVMGARLSGASIRVFKHNDPKHLEKVLRDAIINGQPRSCRPWKKILVIVEGLYSMEGNFACLHDILALKRKYKFYLFLDEAHSIGVIGKTGRGVCEHLGVDHREIDILMGTFTKSFGASGGYLGGRRDMVAYLRQHAHAPIYAETMSFPVLQQVQSSLRQIMYSPTGAARISQIHANSRYFHRKLREMGFVIYGQPDSPIIPLLLFSPAKISAFSREMLKNDIAVVVVGYPATPIITGRVRFCVSAAHSREDLDRALAIISEVGDRMMLKVLPQRTIPPAKGEIMPSSAKDNCIKQPGMKLGLQPSGPRWCDRNLLKTSVMSMFAEEGAEGGKVMKQGQAIQATAMVVANRARQVLKMHDGTCRESQHGNRWWSFFQKMPHQPPATPGTPVVSVVS